MLQPQDPMPKQDPVASDHRSPDARRKTSLRILANIVGSGLIDVAVLAAFAAVDMVPGSAAPAYALGGAIIWLPFYFLLRSRWTQRRRDPFLTTSQMALTGAMELVMSLLYPEAATYLLNLLFIVFAFGALRLTWQRLMASIVVIGGGMALVLLLAKQAIQVPAHTDLQFAVFWFCQLLTITRCALVGVYANRVTAELRERNKQLATAAAQILHLASYDDLTGAMNRKPLWALIEKEAGRRDAARNSFCVAMLDLDRFKSINDRYGHLLGDDALRWFADAVRGVMRASDSLGRYGGEEFIMLLAATPASAAESVAERIRRAVSSVDWSRLAPELTVTVSIGIAVSRVDECVTDLVKRADKALYQAKRLGRNRVVVAPPDGPVYELPAEAAAGVENVRHGR